ncbi:MAG: type II toxin-antitoxin system VapC family toxin [Pirellulales bacterium]
MIRLCLDTSGYSRLMRGHPPLQKRLEEADEILLPATVLGELHAGFLAGTRPEENIAVLAEFRRQPGVAAIDITDNVAERYGAVVADLRRLGRPIPTHDIWIAAAALEHGGRIVAYDDHFAQVPGLLVESP